MDAMTMATRLAAYQYGVISRAQALAAGLTEAQVGSLVRRGTWVRRHRGVYSIAAQQDTSGDRPRLRAAVMAAQLALGPAAFASGATAARLWGMRGLPRWDGRISMTIPAGAGRPRRARGVTVHTWATELSEVTGRGAGIRLTDPGRTLRDVVLAVDGPTAVSLMDHCLSRKLLASDRFAALADRNAGRPGARRSRRWWRRADARAQSPLETRVRLRCHDAGIPPDGLQHAFYSPCGRLIARADLWWSRLNVVAECDGADPYAHPSLLLREQWRRNALMRAVPGVRILRFTWDDLCHPDCIPRAVRRAALRSAGSADPAGLTPVRPRPAS